jgi:serine/threonine-protein kinase
VSVSTPVVPPEPPSLSPDDLIGGRYRLTRRIARGGMAEVWEADDVILSRAVAVKALLPRLASDHAFVVRFRREAIAAARLTHPNIVSIYDTCSQDGCEAIVMELVRGRTLREALDDHRTLPLDTVVDIASQVAAALAHAHAHGLVHRDVKPGNILLGADGRVMVADFGIAKAPETQASHDDLTGETVNRPWLQPDDGHHHDLTAVGDVMGTAKYLAPEQVRGAPIDPRVDVYALGIVLYEMLCGRAPFVGPDPSATANARLTDDPLRPRQVRAGIPRQLEDITLRALARDPDDRYPSAGALRLALGSIDLGGLEARADPTAVTPFPYADTGSTPPGRDRTGGDGYAGPERAWFVPAALILVIAVTLGVVGVLVGTTDVGRGLFESVGVASPHHEPVRVASATSFDPFGSDRTENENEVGRAIDGDPATGWRTELYYGKPNFGGLKEGVGIVLRLAEPTVLDDIVLTSPNRSWTARIYLGDGTATDLTGWGQPAGAVTADQTRTGSPVEASLGNQRASALLIWITNLGDSRDGAYRFELREAVPRN